MRRKKNKRTQSRENRPAKASAAGFSSPFKDLKKILGERATSNRTQSPEPAPAPTRKQPTAHPTPPSSAGDSAPAADDESALLEAYRGVRPLGGGSRVPVKPEVSHAVVSEESEVLAQLYDLVSGQGTFDITETEEYVEGARVGIDPRLVSRLRRGEFALQSHIDLHGMTQPAARQALAAFIQDSVRTGLRTVLVVHGRGLRSPGGHPVLKHATAEWLSHGTIGSHVLAFTSARPSDGGGGATYVLLRRDRRRAPFDVLKGTKRSD